MTRLFEPLTLRSEVFRNRIGVPPMCMYSAEDGVATDWHLVHYATRAAGGAALIIVEATAVEASGRISPGDLGAWDDTHVQPLARIAESIDYMGAVPGIQIAHAGRKASTAKPSAGGGPLFPGGGGWEIFGPSEKPFAEGHQKPHAMEPGEIESVKDAFRAAAARADRAGFRVLEIHAAHGYLLSSFLSPLANFRTDVYGGSFEGRTRLLLETTRGVRSIWPDTKPLFVRISCTDWIEGGWSIEDSVRLAGLLKDEGVDLIDCSSGGNDPDVTPIGNAGYQVPLAESLRREGGIATAAVGLITGFEQADNIISSDQADLVLLGREMLRNPYWPIYAAQKLGAELPTPLQYKRAFL